MEEFFKLCGFEAAEVEKERPRIDRALEILEMGPKDINQAESRLREFFNLELLGVRKALHIWIKRLIDLVLAKEEGKFVIYFAQPSDIRLLAAMSPLKENMLCEIPENVAALTLGTIFGKLTPVLEAAEGNGMPPGLGLCSMNQVRLGVIAKKYFPVPDLTIVSTCCDQTPKTDDLLHEVYGVRTLFIDSCLDSPWGEFPEISPRRVQYMATEIRNCVREIEKITGCELTDEVLTTGRKQASKLWLSMQQLLQMMKNDPLPMSQIDLGLFAWMPVTPSRWAIEAGMDAFKTIIKETKQRIDAGKGVVPKGAPVAVWGYNVPADPTLMRMVENFGLAVPVCYCNWSGPWEMISTYSTFEEKCAEANLRYATFQGGWSMIYKLKEMCREFKADGLLLATPFSCRLYASVPFIVKKVVEDELNIPVLVLEYDVFDNRNYSTEALKTRIETFAEMLKAAKAAKVA